MLVFFTEIIGCITCQTHSDMYIYLMWPPVKDYILACFGWFIGSFSVGARGRRRGWAEPRLLCRPPRRSLRLASWVTWRPRGSPWVRCLPLRRRAVGRWSAPRRRRRLERRKTRRSRKGGGTTCCRTDTLYTNTSDGGLDISVWIQVLDYWMPEYRTGF